MDEQFKARTVQQAIYALAERFDPLDDDEPEQLSPDNEAMLSGAFASLQSLGVDYHELRVAVIRQKIADAGEPDPNEGMDAYLLGEDQRNRMNNGDGPRS